MNLGKEFVEGQLLQGRQENYEAKHNQTEYDPKSGGPMYR